MKKLLIIFIIVALLIMIDYLSGNNYKDKCKRQGGVVVSGYLAQNCWANGQFLEIK